MSKNLKRTIIVGVTGQLGTGKSTVAAIFAEMGAGVINADLLAHQALRPSGACFAKTIRTFGKEILKNGEIDRQKLASIVFSDAKSLKKLVVIIHPFVISETRKQIQQFKKNGKTVVVLDVPLLFESGMDKLTDFTVVAKAPRPVQMTRILKQGRLTRAEALRRMRFQFSMTEKARRADIIVNNGGTIKKTEKQLKKIQEMLKRRY